MKVSLLKAVILAAVPIGSMAQGQDANYKWVGNDISAVINSTEVDMTTVYLYNVGTGKYLNIGSNWGTSVSAYEVGMPVRLTKNADGTYLIQGSLETSDGKYLGFPNPPASSLANEKKADWDRIYCDRKTDNSNIKWTITETGTGSKTYRLYCYNGSGTDMGGNRYLVVDAQTVSHRLGLTYPTTVDNDNANADWKFITLKDLKGAFKAQFASTESPADATFLISDQDMNRSNTKVGEWKVSGFIYNMNSSYSFDQGVAYTYYVGMGNKWDVNDNYQRQYGNYWIGSIRNLGHDDKANGTLTQTVTALKKGWYRLSCDGFFSRGENSGISASIFANVQNYSSDGRSNVSARLNAFKNEFTYAVSDLTKVNTAANVPNESPYIKAAKIFETGTYNNSILVYVPVDNARVNVGIKVENSTEDLDWTAFDNFQLRYCGDNDMVLDEDQTSLEYLDKQELSANNAYTLILKRTMKPNQWNSITLPVALTAAQFKTAFGDQAKLAKLKGQDGQIPTRIDFESVDLKNDEAIVVNPCQLYIMQSTRTASVTEGEYKKKLKDNSTLMVKAPYFTINNVVLPHKPEEMFKESPKSTTTESDNIQFCGTQIKQTDKVVPSHSYVLSGKNGKWYHTTSPLAIKGFRCWIATNVGTSNPAKALTFAIDGTVEGEVTAINGLEQDTRKEYADAAVYNLQGQKVASDISELKYMPAGIYVVNHKKVLIK